MVGASPLSPSCISLSGHVGSLWVDGEKYVSDWACDSSRVAASSVRRAAFSRGGSRRVTEIGAARGAEEKGSEEN